MPRPTALPTTLPPRLVMREAAAAYVGLSANAFDRLVHDDCMPAPKCLSSRRKAWDLHELDAAINLLPAGLGKLKNNFGMDGKRDS